MRKCTNVIEGEVVSGAKLGRKIGYPTINFEIKSIKGNIPYGVYTCYLVCGDKRRRAVLHYGNKYIGRDSRGANVYCEVYVIDYENDLEEKNMSIEVLKKIRDVKKFANITSLQEQIEKDITTTKNFFNHDQQTS